MIQPKKNANGSIIWSDADKEKLCDLFHEGYTDEEIGEQLGRTAMAVCRIRHLLRLRIERRPNKIFKPKGVMADYFPKWYKDKLKREWEQKYNQTSMR